MNPSSAGSGIVTVEHHIIQGQRAHPTATGEFSWLLSGITLATEIIAAQVRRAGLVDLFGSTGRKNVQGEVVQKLDVIANETIQQCLGYRETVSIIVSEETDEPRVLKQATEVGRAGGRAGHRRESTHSGQGPHRPARADAAGHRQP